MLYRRSLADSSADRITDRIPAFIAQRDVVTRDAGQAEHAVVIEMTEHARQPAHRPDLPDAVHVVAAPAVQFLCH